MNVIFYIYLSYIIYGDEVEMVYILRLGLIRGGFLGSFGEDFYGSLDGGFFGGWFFDIFM